MASALVVLTGGPAGSYVLPTSAAGTTLTYTSGLTVVGAAAGGGGKTVTLDNFGDPGFGYNADDYTPAVHSDTDAFELNVPAQPVVAGTCPALGLCTELGTFTFTFNQPVTNPRMHIAELGDIVGDVVSSNTTHTRLTLTTADVTPSVVDGRNLTVSGSTISLTTAGSNADCSSLISPPGCGTILLAGTFTTLTFDVTSFTAARTGSSSSHAADVFGVTFSVDEDFGDAPTSYDGANAARSIRGELALGAGLTADNTATVAATTSPNAGANADGDTDDAFASVNLSPVTAGSSTYALNVPISGASKAGTVCGWIDFDQDDAFDNPGEQACTGFATGATTVALSWSVPSYSPGTTYVRLRAGFTTAQVQSPTGPSDSGEVEDYQVQLQGATLNCAGGVYAVRGADPHDIWSVNTGTGVMTSVAQFATTITTTNALALSANGRYAFSAGSGSVVRHDTLTGATDTFAGVVGAVTTHGAINPVTGIYYYGGLSSGLVSIYGFNTATNTSLGLLASGLLTDATGGNGDWGFDGQGNLFLVAGTGSSNPLISLNQQLPTTSGPAITVSGTLITNVNSSGNAINGLAFAGASLFLASGTTLFEANPTTGAVVNTETMGTSGSVDLASCSTPSTMQVGKNVVSRISSTDQFTVTLTGGGVTTGNTGTTTGTDTGLQTQPAEIAGPVLGQPGTTYTITETAAGTTNLLDYATTWACVDAANGNAAISSGSGTTGTFTVPSTGSSAASVVCTFTNTAAQPSISLDKQAGTPTGYTVGSTITYSFVVTNTGNTSLNPVSVTDPMVGTVTCPTGPLAAGDSRTCTAAPYAITQADVSAGQVQNTATASGTSPGGTVVTGQDSTTTPIAQTRSVTLDKVAGSPVDVNGNGITDVGDQVGYTFTVTNTGNTTLTGLTVTDPMLGTVTCVSTTLAPGASTSCSAAAYTVTAADQTAGSVVNTATADGTAAGQPVTSSDSTTTNVVTPNPSISIDKQAGTPTGNTVGSTITYTFVVTNTGNVALDPVTVTDPKVGTVTCPPGALAPGAQQTCTAAPYAITQADIDDGSVQNTAIASGSPVGGGSAVTGQDSTNTAITQVRQLVLDKSAAAPVDVNSSGLTDAGDTIAYSFTVLNNGNVTMTDVGVTDPKVGPVSCTPQTLAPGQAATCTAPAYVVTAADEAAGSVANTAQASGTAPGNVAVQSNTDSTDTPVTARAPELSLDKVAGTPVDVNNSGITDAGDTIAYTFAVENTGNLPVSSIAITDPKLGAVTCAPTALAPGQTASCTADDVYVVTEADEAAGSVDNSATATGTDPDGGDLESDPDTTSTPVTTPAPSLGMEKTASSPLDVNDSGITDAGDTIQYTFAVTNTGNVPVSGVAIEDDLAGPVTCVPTTLQPGQSASCSADDPYVITAADEAALTVTNTATATGTDPDGGDVTSDPDSTNTATTPQSPALSLEKFAAAPVDVNDSGLTDAGDTIAYTFTVTNTGNVPVGNLVIDDPKVGAVTCVPTSLPPGASATCTTDTPYVVTEGDEQSGSVENVAHAEGDDPDGDPVASNTDTTSTPTTAPVTELVFEKSAGTPVDVNDSGITDAGDTIVYEFTVWNLGNVPVSGVTVSDPLVGTVTCAAPVLQPDESTDCVADAAYVVTDADEAAGSVDNTASAVADDPDGDPVTSPPDSTSTPVTTPGPSLVLDKRSGLPEDTNQNDVIDAGDTIAYSFVLTNDGNVPLVSALVTDPKAGTVSCPTLSIPVGQSLTCTGSYTLVQADVNAGSVLNTAVATAIAPDQVLVTSNQDSTTTPMVADPELTIEKTGVLTDTDQDDRAEVGEEIVYTFTVTNTGTVTVVDVAVDDPKAGAVTCVSTELEPGESTECRADAPYVVRQGDVDRGRVVNVATATGRTPTRSLVESRPDTEVTVTEGAPTLGLVKSNVLLDDDGDGKADVGEVIQYSFLVSNSGTVRLTGISIDDPMLDEIVCPMHSLEPGFEMTCLGTYVAAQVDVERGGMLLNVATAVSDTVTSPAAGTRTAVDVLGNEGTEGTDNDDGNDDGDGDGDGNGNGDGDSGTLPDTGGPARQLPWFAGGLMLLGVLMVGWSRRESGVERAGV